MRELTDQLEKGVDLGSDDVTLAADDLLDENISVDEKASFLKALASKGETPSEIAAFVECFLSRAVNPQIEPGDLEGPTIDVCGTGGDKLDLFNVSTATIFILAAIGINVVKHGNRGITSKSGGADVLEALGVPIDLPPERFAECMRSHGAGFLFAPQYHPAFKAVVPVRQMLAKEGIRTVFNLIGPLLNPARPDYQLVGVFDPALTEPFAEIMRQLGRKAAWVVHGKTDDGRGMDELSTLGSTHVSALKDGNVSNSTIAPSELGLQPATLADLKGGDAEQNADILRAILDGSDNGPKRDIVCLNAAAAIAVCGKAADLENGFATAIAAVDSGAAAAKLSALSSFA